MEDNRATLAQIYDKFAEQFQESILALAKINPALAKKMNARGYGLFNSDPRTTLVKGKVYVIGLNPGGDDEDNNYATETIDWWTNRDLGWNAYYDEHWNGNNFSQHQTSIREVLARVQSKDLEQATRTTFSTNLHFYKTPGEVELAEYPRNLVDCWKYHSQFLEIIKPEIILCVGNGEANSSFAQVYDKIGRGSKKYTIELNPHRHVKAFRVDDKLVIGIPHLSRPYASLKDIVSKTEKMVKML